MITCYLYFNNNNNIIIHIISLYCIRSTGDTANVRIYSTIAEVHFKTILKEKLLTGYIHTYIAVKYTCNEVE